MGLEGQQRGLLLPQLMTCPRPTVHPPLHPPPACSYDLKGLREHLEQGGYMYVRLGCLHRLAAAAGWLPWRAAGAASRSSLPALCHRSARFTCPATVPTVLPSRCTQFPEALYSRYTRRSGQVTGEIFFFEFGKLLLNSHVAVWMSVGAGGQVRCAGVDGPRLAMARIVDGIIGLSRHPSLAAPHLPTHLAFAPGVACFWDLSPTQELKILRQSLQQ